MGKRKRRPLIRDKSLAEIIHVVSTHCWIDPFKCEKEIICSVNNAQQIIQDAYEGEYKLQPVKEDIDYSLLSTVNQQFIISYCISRILKDRINRNSSKHQNLKAVQHNHEELFNKGLKYIEKEAEYLKKLREIVDQKTSNYLENYKRISKVS